MFRRLIPILMMCCSCTTGFVQMNTTKLSPANLFRSPSRSAMELLSAYARTPLMPEAEVTGAAEQSSSGAGTTWYVRPDGGTRYSSNVTSGQCDGKGDAPYSGSGANQHCAFNDFRMLFQDGSRTTGSTFPGWGWVIAGGDTVIIRGSIGTGVSYRVGANNSSAGCDSTGCWGVSGDPGDSGPPRVPSGTSGAHTKILGENYASCTSQNVRAQLHGGWGIGTVFQLAGSNYVDTACLDITDFSNCGVDNDVVACQRGVSDFASHGIQLTNTATHISLTDVRVHGLAADGILGAPGTGFVANDLAIVGNADAGWNADDGSGQTGVGTLNVTNFNISWNGCVEEYPITDSLPYFSCTDDVSGGYGDGFGTASANSPAPGWQVSFDQGVVSYNTQDGLDFLHISGAGSTTTVTRTLVYGNEGQQIKSGVGALGTLQNNVIVGNCAAMSTQAISGTPAGFGSRLRDPCRGNDTAVVLFVNPGLPTKYQNNTIFSAGIVSVEVEYGTGDQGSANTLLFNNNVTVGFPGASSGRNPAPIYSNSNLAMLTNPGSSWTHNATYGWRDSWTCPFPGETGAVCVSPQLVDMTYHPYGYGDMSPQTGSPLIGAGVPVANIAVDISGITRSSTPSIGAYEPESAGQSAPPVVTPPVVTPPVVTPPVVTPPVVTPPVVTPTGTWSKIANEGDTVTIPAGVTVRYGAQQGTPPGNSAVSQPLPADSFDPPVTFATDTTFVVSNSVFGADPAQNYVKELEELSGSAATPPASDPPPPTPTVTWLKIAKEGDTVTIPSGLTVRYGARQGTPPGNSVVSQPLATDSFDPPITLNANTTFAVSNSVFGADPAYNYVKELDVEPSNSVVYVNGVAISLASISP
jgi:hypothetical protein